MNTTTCEHALQLAARKELSGPVLSARWHVRHCPRCQCMMSELETQIAVLDDRLALQKLLDIDLGEAICQRSERVITWLAHSTRQVLAVAIRLSEPTTPLVSVPQLAMLGDTDELKRSVIRQDVEQTSDGSQEWRITFIVDSADPEHCIAEVEVKLFDRWNLSDIRVFMTWDSDQRRGQTDERGQVRFAQIPVEALGRINVIIHPPPLPTSMNGPQ